MCDCLVALPAATGGATLFAKNSDRPPAEVQLVEWSPARLDTGRLRATHVDVDVYPRATIGTLLSRPAWCWGAEHGVNTAGVAIGNASIYTTLDPRSTPAALIGMDFVRLGLERGSTAAEAVAVITTLLAQYGQGGTGHDPVIMPLGRPYWNSFLVADPHEAFVVETSGRDFAVQQVEAVAATSNRTTIASFDAAHRHPRQPVEGLVDPRLGASRQVLARRPVTVDSLAAHLRSHESCGTPGWSVCMHVDGVEATTASMITELPAGSSPLAWVLVGRPCEQQYEQFVVSPAGLVAPA
ncbi:MAG: hypothetical protein ABIQ39_08210 [Ilumatobacteraceae bacterium]